MPREPLIIIISWFFVKTYNPLPCRLMRQNIWKKVSWTESLIDLRKKLFGYWQID